MAQEGLEMVMAFESVDADNDVENPRTIVARRSFKKSRSGCRTCKERKVKCDETHPLCKNCARRFKGLKCCDFEEITKSPETRPRRTSSKKAPRSICPLPTTVSAYPSEGSGSRILELKLMHHYTTTTCCGMPGSTNSQKREVWAVDIPKLAFSSNLVLSALLGISALHLSALQPNDPSLATTAQRYFDQAVSQHRMALSSVEDHNAEALLATALLICHHTWLASHSTVVAPDAPYEFPLQTYYMARGIAVLFEKIFLVDKDFFQASDLSEGVSFDEVEVETANALTAQYQTFLMSAQADLDILSRTFDEPDVLPEAREVYHKAVLEISTLCYAITYRAEQAWIQSRIATMPVRLPLFFLELVAAKDQRALALLARNLALLKIVDDIWWLHGTGETQRVAENAITGIQSLMQSNWTWTMEWPLQIMGSGLATYEWG